MSSVTGHTERLPIFAFACWHKCLSESQATIINAHTRSKARYEHWLDVRDAWSEAKLIDINVRKVGGPHSSERFIENAKYRGMPSVRCGQRVRVAEIGEGAIVGHNSSANFDVLFETGRCAGQTLNCHPQSVELLSDDGVST